MDVKKLELLSPAGNMEKLRTVLHFGADAVYLAGKSFGLRAFGENFDEAGLTEAINLVHGSGKRAYVTVNIFAHNRDFAFLTDYLKFLESINVDAIIVSDPGIVYLARKTVPKMELHLSTQANATNKYAAAFWGEMGISRIVLSREMTLCEVREIRDFLKNDVELEAFVHGAMCMAYSGRCILSNYLSGRSANRGECSQSCRWEYALVEQKRDGEYFKIEEDERGSYILSSKDLCMLEHLDKLIDAGITSFKIEGRVKSAYYAGVITGAYRRALDITTSGGVLPKELVIEPYKTNHRTFCNGFYFGGGDLQDSISAKPTQSHEFVATVLDRVNGGIIVEMRNRFKVGETLEVVSPTKFHNAQLKVKSIKTLGGDSLQDAIVVQQKLLIECDYDLLAGDMLRRELK